MNTFSFSLNYKYNKAPTRARDQERINRLVITILEMATHTPDETTIVLRLLRRSSGRAAAALATFGGARVTHRRPGLREDVARVLGDWRVEDGDLEGP